MLVDIALQALSPAVNAPTTAHQVHLDQPVHTWEDIINLTFTEIQYYGKDDPQTRWSLGVAFDSLLAKVPDDYKPPIERQKALLLSEGE